MPPELLPPASPGEAAANGPSEEGLPEALRGYAFRAGRRGPASTLRPPMVPIIAHWLARTGVKRIAAAKAGTTEDCLDQWLRRGLDATRRRKASIYTELLAACEEAWAHRYAYLIELGERTVEDRHTNPRFVTWLMAVTAPRQFTVPREPGPTRPASKLGPAFEMVTPEAAAQALEEKLQRFLALEAQQDGERAAGAEEPAAAQRPASG